MERVGGHGAGSLVRIDPDPCGGQTVTMNKSSTTGATAKELIAVLPARPSEQSPGSLLRPRQPAMCATIREEPVGREASRPLR